MSFKLLSVSTMYPGYLEMFYRKFPGTAELDYHEHNSVIINESTEFSGIYNRGFRKLGIEASCIIANDSRLQGKWEPSGMAKPEDQGDILLDQVRFYRPDVLWIENINFAGDGWIEKVRDEVSSIRLIVAYHCSPFNSKILDLFRKADFVVTCTPGLKNELVSKGLNSYLVYHAFDKSILGKISQGSSTRTHDLIFSGSLTAGAGYHSERIAFIETLLKNGVDIDLYVNLESKLRIFTKRSLYIISKVIGEKNSERLSEYYPSFKIAGSPGSYYSSKLLMKSHPPLYGLEMYNLFNESGIVLNFHLGAAGNYAGNMRMFEVTGVGSCLLTDNKRNLADLFDAGNEVVVFDSAEDCISKAKWLMEHEEERRRIAMAGQRKTLESHTVDNRCCLIKEIIEKELKNPKN
jgi:spore maturation protein CgeB